MSIDGTLQSAASTSLSLTRSSGEIQAWIVRSLEAALELEPGELDVEDSFDRYGLDSVEAVNLVAALEDWLELELDPALAYEHPSIRLLSEHLAQRLDETVRAEQH